MSSEAETPDSRTILFGTLRGHDRETRLSGYRDAVEERVRENGGRLFDFQPDGIVAAFRSSKDAVACAMAIQREVGQVTSGPMDPGASRFAFGIHRGSVAIDEAGIEGVAIEGASRLERLSDPGGVCLSGSVRGELRDEMDLHTIDVGLREIEEGRSPVAVHRLIVGRALLQPEVGRSRARAEWPGAGRNRIAISAAFAALVVLATVGVWFAGTPSEVPPLVASVAARPPTVTSAATLVRPSLVVVPFRGTQPGALQSAFAGGVSEALESDFLGESGLLVVVPPPHAGFGSRSARNLEITRDLGARYALEGTVQRLDAHRLVVTAELFDAENGFRHFHAQYERGVGELSEIRRAIRERVLGVLEIDSTQAAKPADRG